jgi:hypothetical protein
VRRSQGSIARKLKSECKGHPPRSQFLGISSDSSESADVLPVLDAIQDLAVMGELQM